MESYEEMASIFKAFDDVKRLFIIDMVKSGEICACDILEKMKISQPTLSHHMKILCDSGIVKARKDGKWMYYSINENGIKSAVEILNSITERSNTSVSVKNLNCSA